MSQVISITGNLGADPERRSYTQEGVEKSIATFNVAANRPFKREGRPDTDWFRVKVFGPQADSCLKYLEKGRTVHVIGRLEFDSYEHKTARNEDGSPVRMLSAEVNADSVTFLGGGQGGEGGQRNGGGPAQQAAPAPAAASSDDDMPF